MPTGPVRDADRLRAGLERWLRGRHAERTGLRVASFERASVGFSNETIVVAAEWDGPDGGGRERLVVRLPAIEAVHPQPDLGVEAQVQTVLAQAGVPAPAPAVAERDPNFLGVEFLVMPFVDGRVGPQAPGADEWLLGLPPSSQRRVAKGFVELLARVHGVDAGGAGLEAVLRGAGTTIEDEIDWWRGYLDWAAGTDPPPPILDEMLSWCAAHAPTSEPAASLLWGDARLGNAILAADGAIVAALDWDMAFLGPAEHDLGWYLGLDGLTAALLGQGVPGFPDRDELVSTYEHRLGRGVVDLEWYEIFALVRSSAVAFRLSVLASATGTATGMPAPEQSPMVPYIRNLMAQAT